jgi:hypothetical protein
MRLLVTVVLILPQATGEPMIQGMSRARGGRTAASCCGKISGLYDSALRLGEGIAVNANGESSARELCAWRAICLMTTLFGDNLKRRKKLQEIVRQKRRQCGTLNCSGLPLNWRRRATIIRARLQA